VLPNYFFFFAAFLAAFLAGFFLAAFLADDFAIAFKCVKKKLNDVKS
jgi:hypothetical protein